MRREKAKALLPIIQAWVEGKTIQYKNHVTNEWTDVVYDVHFAGVPDDYRVKPDPVQQMWDIYCTAAFDNPPMLPMAVETKKGFEAIVEAIRNKTIEV